MDVPTILLRDLRELSSSIGVDDDAILSSLEALLSALQAAVPSCLGLSVTINGDAPIHLNTFRPTEDGEQVTSSLRLPLPALAPGFAAGSRIVFYATTPGAFVDLGADVEYALEHRFRAGAGADGDGHEALAGDGAGGAGRLARSGVVLDADLPPPTSRSGLSGLEELATINQAIGFLIAEGHDLDEARALLQQRAAAAGTDLHVYAAQLLER